MKRNVARAVLAAALVSAPGCAWFTDFKQQPKMDPWETAADTIAMRGNPQGSVPIYGSVAPGFAYDRAATPAAIAAMSDIPNPVPADARSLRSGAQQYQINCVVCHGALGAGDGPVTAFGFPPIPIGAGSPAATRYSDGFLFGIIRNGRGLMPSYNRIEESERWDLINYMRAIQSGATNLPATAVGRPGETGIFVPGASVSAPTRPAPHAAPPVLAAPTSAPVAPPAPHTP